MSASIATGWVVESNAEYHAKTHILGASGIVALSKKCPAFFRWGQSGPSEEVGRKGTAVHAAVLEPDEFARKALVLPDVKYVGSGKTHWLNFFDTAVREAGVLKPDANIYGGLLKEELLGCLSEDAICMTLEEKARCLKISAAVRSHSVCGPLLYETVNEVSGYAQLSVDFDGRTIKCRPDARNLEKGIIVDLKTCEDCDDFRFLNYGYHIKASWILNVANLIDAERYREFVWIVVENSSPHLIRLYRMEIDSTEYRLANELCNRALAEWCDCLERDYWPAYNDDATDISYPRWYIEKVAKSSGEIHADSVRC